MTLFLDIRTKEGTFIRDVSTYGFSGSSDTCYARVFNMRGIAKREIIPNLEQF